MEWLSSNFRSNTTNFRLFWDPQKEYMYLGSHMHYAPRPIKLTWRHETFFGLSNMRHVFQNDSDM